jgi:hypothetical protein
MDRGERKMEYGDRRVEWAEIEGGDRRIAAERTYV